MVVWICRVWITVVLLMLTVRFTLT